jgi:hypothetical protein
MTSAEVLALAPSRSNSSQATPCVSASAEIAIGSTCLGLRPEFEHAVAENVHDPAIR